MYKPGANILSISKAVVAQCGLHLGSLLNITVDNHRIIFTPEHAEPTLEGILTPPPRHTLIRQ